MTPESVAFLASASDNFQFWLKKPSTTILVGRKLFAGPPVIWSGSVKHHDKWIFPVLFKVFRNVGVVAHRGPAVEAAQDVALEQHVGISGRARRTEIELDRREVAGRLVLDVRIQIGAAAELVRAELVADEERHRGRQVDHRTVRGVRGTESPLERLEKVDGGEAKWKTSHFVLSGDNLDDNMKNEMSILNCVIQTGGKKWGVESF